MYVCDRHECTTASVWRPGDNLVELTMGFELGLLSVVATLLGCLTYPPGPAWEQCRHCFTYNFLLISKEFSFPEKLK